VNLDRAAINPELLLLLDAWPTLPVPIKTGILAMVQAAGA
jgi:hypothetical protein